MKKIKLYRKNGEDLFTIVSDEDFSELSKYTWYAQVDSKTPSLKYVYRYFKKCIYMHRQIMGDKKGFHVDHINRNTLDNRRENLRHVTYSESVKNRGKYLKKIIESTGTTRVLKKYQAQITINGKSKYLGIYETMEEAHQVYLNNLKETES
jgi:hypothetical protein